MNEPSPRIDFAAYSEEVPPGIPAAVQQATGRFAGSRQARVAELPQWEDLREAASRIRLHTLEALDFYIERLSERVQAAGGSVHYAADAAQARQIALEIAQRHGARLAVKSKSMAIEEIELNRAFAQAGIEALETDLGEYIIQLAGTGPSHIIVPAVHLTKEEIAELFRQKLGVDAPPDPHRLTQIARAVLREKFLSAQVGISGANFLVAETGTLVLVSNEGNGRMVTTLPEVHIAIAGIEKIVPDWEALTVLLKLLARSATGQKLSTYTSFITGPRRAEGEFGPREFHLILLDNGRHRLLRDPLGRQTLKCIRCGACLNVCPVYKNVGGFAYGWFISGPIGAIFSPQMLGLERAGQLPFASSLCGACAEVCPVKIPIPQILVELRRRAMEGDSAGRSPAPLPVRLTAAMSALFLRLPWLYRLGMRLMPVFSRLLARDGWIPALPPPASRWTDVRPFPVFAARFRSWWKQRNVAVSAVREQAVLFAQPHEPAPKEEENATVTLSPRQAGTRQEETARLLEELRKLSARGRSLTKPELTAALQALVEEQGIRRAAVWDTPRLRALRVTERLSALGVEVVPPGADKRALAECDLGITEADFALPETGTLGLLSSAEKPRAVSLLPRVHLAILSPQSLRPDLHPVFQEAKGHPYLVFITGPSRTADIELTVTLGVHGPQALYAWMLDE